MSKCSWGFQGLWSGQNGEGGYLGRKDKSDLVLGNLFLSSFSTPFINYYDLLRITFSFLVFLLSCRFFGQDRNV